MCGLWVNQSEVHPSKKRSNLLASGSLNTAGDGITDRFVSKAFKLGATLPRFWHYAISKNVHFCVKLNNNIIAMTKTKHLSGAFTDTNAELNIR